MSRATCVARFPDGELRCATYNGTSDVVSSRLYTVGEWQQMEEWPPMDWSVDPDANEAVPVELACNYGFGMTGRGYATKDYILGPYRNSDTWNDDIPTAPGTNLPIWWPWPIEDWDRRFSE